MTQKFIVEQYPRKVLISNSRRNKYFIQGRSPKPTAKRYQDKDKYIWKKIGSKTMLVNKDTGKPVIANPRSAGTPKYMSVNAQLLYNAKMNQFTRAKVISHVKDHFAPYVDELKPMQGKVKLKITIADVELDDKNNSWDLDNRGNILLKAICDCLTGNHGRCKQIIGDDSVLYIRNIEFEFIPIEDTNKRYLIVELTQ